MQQIRRDRLPVNIDKERPGKRKAVRVIQRNPLQSLIK